jgi:type IV pilus assembly protein PilY1
MKKNYIKIKILIVTSLLLTLSKVSAIPLFLKDEPLYLSQSVPPALAITFDDSGSMAWGWMPSGRSYQQVSLTSTDYNRIYYNPAINYRPPVHSDGSSFPNSNYESAQFDGFYLGGDTGSDLGELIDLSDDYSVTWWSYPNYNNGDSSINQQPGAGPSSGGGFYRTWNGPGNPTQNGDSGTGAGEYTLHTMNSATAEEKLNFANWYTYYNTRGKLAKAAVSHAFVNFGPDFKIDWQQLNNLSYHTSGKNMDLFANGHRDDFYDWLYSIPASGGTPLRLATQRAGELFRQGSLTDTDSPYYDANYGSELSCQQNFHIAISDGGWNSAGGASTNSDNSSATFPALDPSGVNLVYSYSPTTLPSSMYASDTGNTLADKAFDYWRRDLRSSLENRVPPYVEDFTDRNGSTVVVPDGEQWWQQPALFWNPHNDPATWQHMVNFNIGLGVFGALDPQTSLSGIRDGSISWPGTGSASGLIDDVWHASLNSRGKFFSARDPAQLATALNKVVSNIITRKGRASAGSVSGNVVGLDSFVYKTGFDTSDWTGLVTASVLNSDGSTGSVQWDASCKLTGGLCPTTGTVVSASNTPSSRKIITTDGYTKYNFTGGSLPSIAIGKLLSSQFIMDAGSLINLTDVVNYLRGDQSLEIQNGGVLRDRRSILGDVIHSSPLLIRGPSANYDDEIWPDLSPEKIAADAGNGYEDFRTTNKFRNSVVLTGANDGMLHAFDSGLNNPSNGGDELWAFIPSSSFDHMGKLLDPAYQHKSFVDAAPFVRDSFIGGSWSTIALGNLRHGGKLFYALDLGANPEGEPDVLWEFSDNQDPDMGYTYSGGIIVRVYDPSSHESKWVAILPNGYNSSNQQSVMYAVDLATGSILHKWLGTGGSNANPNGMGPPVAADFVAYDPSDPTVTSYAADQGTDFIYAGDLHGNVYKLDALDVFSSGDSVAEILFNGSTDQPITTPPRVFTPGDATEDVLVIFGTGKYIETPDRDVNTTPTQFLMGLRDAKDSYSQYSISDVNGRIVEQDVTESTSGFREVTNNLVSSTQGWITRLPSQGERMVNVLGRDNRSKTLLSLSIIPTGLDPCLPGGQSWVMLLDARSGGSKADRPFRSGHADGVFVADLVLGANILTTPGGNRTTLNLDTTGTGSANSINIELPTKVWGRKSWHRIILD